MSFSWMKMLLKMSRSQMLSCLTMEKEYPAQQIRCDVINSVATYKLKFKRFTVFRNCKVILTVNGEKVSIDIQKKMLDR